MIFNLPNVTFGNVYVDNWAYMWLTLVTWDESGVWEDKLKKKSDYWIWKVFDFNIELIGKECMQYWLETLIWSLMV